MIVATIQVEFSPEERTKLKLQPKQDRFTKRELEEMKTLVGMALPSSQMKEDNNWKESAFYEKAGYFVDFMQWGENAQSHQRKLENEALINKINKAIEQLPK